MARASLFIVGLPRSLSSRIYHAVRRSIGLREPEWTSDGEILNVRRFALLGEEGSVEGIKYVERGSDGRRFGQLRAFLDQVTRAEGFAYKDVIQPFVVADWLAANALPVLYLDRPVPDVADAMLERGWLYPASAAAVPGVEGIGAGGPALEHSLVNGLMLARKALRALAAERVHYDDLIHDEAPLWRALRALYGDEGLPQPTYLDQEFCRVRDQVLSRRLSARYLRLLALCAELERESEEAG